MFLNDRMAGFTVTLEVRHGNGGKHIASASFRHPFQGDGPNSYRLVNRWADELMRELARAADSRFGRRDTAGLLRYLESADAP